MPTTDVVFVITIIKRLTRKMNILGAEFRGHTCRPTHHKEVNTGPCRLFVKSYVLGFFWGGGILSFNSVKGHQDERKASAFLH